MRDLNSVDANTVPKSTELDPVILSGDVPLGAQCRATQLFDHIRWRVNWLAKSVGRYDRYLLVCLLSSAGPLRDRAEVHYRRHRRGRTSPVLDVPRRSGSHR